MMYSLSKVVTENYSNLQPNIHKSDELATRPSTLDLFRHTLNSSGKYVFAIEIDISNSGKLTRRARANWHYKTRAKSNHEIYING